jgi:hypothetical protein
MPSARNGSKPARNHDGDKLTVSAPSFSPYWLDHSPGFRYVVLASEDSDYVVAQTYGVDGGNWMA